MGKKIVMDDGWDKELAEIAKHGKQLEKELAKAKKSTATKKKVKRK